MDLTIYFEIPRPGLRLGRRCILRLLHRLRCRNNSRSSRAPRSAVPKNCFFSWFQGTSAMKVSDGFWRWKKLRTGVRRSRLASFSMDVNLTFTVFCSLSKAPRARERQYQRSVNVPRNATISSISSSLSAGLSPWCAGNGAPVSRFPRYFSGKSAFATSRLT